jgi:hypothetical protein
MQHSQTFVRLPGQLFNLSCVHFHRKNVSNPADGWKTHEIGSKPAVVFPEHSTSYFCALHFHETIGFFLIHFRPAPDAGLQ